MKFLGPLFATTFFSISYSESKLNLAPVVTNCQLLLPVPNNSQTVILATDNHHPDTAIMSCIHQDSVFKQSVILLNTYFRLNVTRSFILTNYNPNVIVTTKHLTPKMFSSLLWRYFVKSNWSLLYIVVTGEQKFKCKNGTMTPKDFSLLENTMNNLWHRFQIMRVGLVFPFACSHKMVIYDGKTPSTGNLYDRSIKIINATNYDEIQVAIQKSGENLAHGYPMQAGLFYRFPTAIKDCENLHYYVHFNLNLTFGFCGLDGMVTYDILSHLKFNVSYCQDEKCNFYGYGLQGNFSGALGCTLDKEIDISFNSRFMTHERSTCSDEEANYLHYVTTDKLCALVKKPDVVPLWHGVFNLYSPTLWAVIVAVLVAIGGIMRATAIIDKSMTGTEIMSFGCYLHNSVIMTMLGNSPMKTRSLLMLRSACLMGSVFFMALYQGHISRVYTTVEHFHKIKTLNELYCSGATLYTSPGVKKFLRSLQNPEDKLQEKFLDRAHLTAGNRVGVILTQPDVTTIGRKSDAKMTILEQYSDDHGSPLIDIVDECFYTAYLSAIARSGFPFVEDIQKITERLNEAGLPNMYYKWTQNILEIPNWITENGNEPRAFSKIRLKDQYVAFGILVAGIIGSVIVFAAEMWIGRRKNLTLCERRT